MKTPLRTLLYSAVLAASLTGCMPTEPSNVIGPANKDPNATTDAGIPGTTPTGPDTTIPATVTLNGLLNCNSDIENGVLVATQPTSAIGAQCNAASGPALHFGFQTTVPTVVEVVLDDTNLMNVSVIGPTTTGSACMGTTVQNDGVRTVSFAAQPNSQYILLATTNLANVGDTYDLNLNCRNF